MKNKLASLQALRGIAALLVLLFHYRFYLRGNDDSGTTVWDALFGWGIIGVDIFFVISGFIMVYTTSHYPQGFASAKRFLINRAIRLIPLYYVGLLIAFFIGGAMSTFHYPEKVQNLISALTFTVYNTHVTPHYINDSGMYNIRWTLNYEIYFYLIFTLCLLVRHRFIALLAWGALATVIIPYLAGFRPTLSVQGYNVDTPLAGLLSNPLLLEFLVGAIVGYLYIGIKQTIRSCYLPYASAVIASGLLLYLCQGIYTGDIRALELKSALAIGAFILALTLAEPVFSGIIPKALIYSGNISFSLYLLHSPVGLAIMKRFGPAETVALNGIPCVIVAAAVSVAAAHVTHKYIEVRLTRWLKAKLLPPARFSADAAGPARKAS